ncbi:Proteasome/cyclosome repeat family protein [Histomonas meleagridis]|uniref:Proteasome/cyclosome repeat family protein n=1 Tax=Histomonas meleagridis TaxID=135588 RepID=UPI00355AC8E5|nr:Proteasome/cyclosome repeat family protein [Histomonas meleagridis]KAH0797540.1 Proteasome/cyclosome repeat family protein [Histomonas meleagridis]
MWGSAPAFLAMLNEKNINLRIYGLQMLHQIMENEWPLIADQELLLIKLAKDQSFVAHKNAALLVSRMFYHLGNLAEAVHYAILAEEEFNPAYKSEYTSTVVSQSIQEYIKLINSGQTPLDALKRIIQNLLDDLIQQNKISQCLCIAIETRFLDYVQRSIQLQPSLVGHAIILTMNTVADSSYRQQLLQEFVNFAQSHCNKFQLSQLYQALQKPKSVADLLTALIQSHVDDHTLLAYQIGFELAENASQKFISEVNSSLPEDPEFDTLKNIICRQVLLDQYLQFLFKNNKTDIHVIVALKDTLNNSRMLVHSSVIMAYSFMYAGTGDDNFYRNNTQWFSTGKNWALFMTIAAVGAIHIGHLKAALQVLQSFLNKSTPQYALGGGLFALGLIYANYTWNQTVLDKITTLMNSSQSIVVKHGGCLALGLISMGSQNQEYYRIAKEVSLSPSPEAGEAAGYAIGMIMLGCGECDELNDLEKLASTTEHEKITRGCAMGLALMMYGLEEKSEKLVERLLQSRIPLMRESAAWVTALAYVGTASNTALQRLLHLAVSDVNPDVRRAAVIGVGFVLSRSYKEVPGMVDLLAKSYHPHVRSGAALALGIACAGTGMTEAINILEPLLNDLEDFVKQSAMIAMAMVLQQQSDKAVPYTKEFRAYLRKLITKKRNDLQVFGMCLAYGILNAGGRNVVISCNSLRGENSVLATVAIALFCNYFYWHPLALMLPLAFHPTAVIGLDKNLNIVDWEILSRGSRKLYANPPSFDSEKEEIQLGKAAVLSITKKMAANEEENIKKEMEIEEEEEDEDDEIEVLKNPSRVTLNQLSGIDLNFNKRYKPITGQVFHGFVMLKEATNEEEDEDE